MRHQLNTVFDDLCKAQGALDRLRRSGYTSADVLLTKVPGVTQTASIRSAVKRMTYPIASPVRLLSRLFALDDGDTASATAATRSPDRYALTLSTCSAAEADRADSLITNFTHTDREDARLSTPAEQTKAAPDADQGNAALEPRWYDTRDTGQYFVGTREVKNRCTTAAGEPKHSPFHWPGTPRDLTKVKQVNGSATDTEVEASTAFRFACHLHENPRFRNRSWNEASGDLKVLWEAHDPAGPGWESSESVLHRGWDSTKPEIDDDSYRRSHWNVGYRNYSAQRRAKQAPSPIPASSATKAAWKEKHPGELTPWENFMDAVKHGWEKITLGDDTDQADYRPHHANTHPRTP